ncbi:hypothetical protein INT48_004078 [Thamnidium elegans]|uniref:Uncharacterized protein n=1 Tax=Thamnidium elegans TaxID=101142 RepID=A0A8H7SK41_9FUNG|nr:hypothetical protein INT48_004078 [Thamnidium elegans]
MSKPTDQNDLSTYWNSLSISSEEEKLTQKLNKTHLVNKSNIFCVPTPSQQTKDQPDLHTFKQWNDNNTTDEDEGWGKGPPGYTSITQGTYFGFNSIMETPVIATMSDPTQPSTSEAFSRFKNTPVSFTSAAAANQQPEQNK